MTWQRDMQISTEGSCHVEGCKMKTAVEQKLDVAIGCAIVKGFTIKSGGFVSGMKCCPLGAVFVCEGKATEELDMPWLLAYLGVSLAFINGFWHGFDRLLNNASTEEGKKGWALGRKFRYQYPEP